MVHRQLLVLAQLLCVVSAAADGRKGLKGGSSAAAGAVADERHPAITSGTLLELTNVTLEGRLRAVASPERCIIFTTTSAYLPPLLNMTRNWFSHVHKCDQFQPDRPLCPCQPGHHAAARARYTLTDGQRPARHGEPV